jgi:hypothetical protein
LENDIRKHLPNIGGLEYEDDEPDSASNNESIDYQQNQHLTNELENLQEPNEEVYDYE